LYFRRAPRTRRAGPPAPPRHRAGANQQASARVTPRPGGRSRHRHRPPLRGAPTPLPAPLYRASTFTRPPAGTGVALLPARQPNPCRRTGKPRRPSLVSKPKGIYKPADLPYALSIRINLDSPYSDGGPVRDAWPVLCTAAATQPTQPKSYQPGGPTSLPRGPRCRRRGGRRRRSCVPGTPHVPATRHVPAGRGDLRDSPPGLGAQVRILLRAPRYCQARPEGYQYGPRAVVQHRLTSAR
jgi:hypothetical protein